MNYQLGSNFMKNGLPLSSVIKNCPKPEIFFFGEFTQTFLYLFNFFGLRKGPVSYASYWHELTCLMVSSFNHRVNSASVLCLTSSLNNFIVVQALLFQVCWIHLYEFSLFISIFQPLIFTSYSFAWWTIKGRIKTYFSRSPVCIGYFLCQVLVFFNFVIV